MLTKSGTWTTAPVSSVAALVTLDTGSPFTPGSVSHTEGPALARLYVLELDDAPDLPVERDVHSVAELVRGDGFGQSAAILVERHEILGERREHLGTVLADDDEILDAHAAQSGEVDPGLDGDHVPGLERPFRRRAQDWKLVHLEPDSMAETVENLETAVLDLAPGGFVQRAPFRACAHI